MKSFGLIRVAVLAAAILTPVASVVQFQMERLSRGVVAERTNSSQVYVGWRLFGTDAAGTAFNLYRSSNGGAAMLLNGAPLTASTNFVDTSAPGTNTNAYFVRPVVGTGYVNSSATASRTGVLRVNGTAQNLTFAPTGSWTTWATQNVTATLNNNAGNVIRFESNGQDLANIDQIEIL